MGLANTIKRQIIRHPSVTTNKARHLLKWREGGYKPKFDKVWGSVSDGRFGNLKYHLRFKNDQTE